jgi:hypothetical protein
VATKEDAVAKSRNDALVDEIEQTREHLARTIDELVDRASPKNIASRQVDRVKARFVAPDGSPRFETIVPVVGGVVAVVAAAVVLRRLLK